MTVEELRTLRSQEDAETEASIAAMRAAGQRTVTEGTIRKRTYFRDESMSREFRDLGLKPYVDLLESVKTRLTDEHTRWTALFNTAQGLDAHEHARFAVRSLTRSLEVLDHGTEIIGDRHHGLFDTPEPLTIALTDAGLRPLPGLRDAFGGRRGLVRARALLAEIDAEIMELVARAARL